MSLNYLNLKFSVHILQYEILYSMIRRIHVTYIQLWKYLSLVWSECRREWQYIEPYIKLADPAALLWLRYK